MYCVKQSEAGRIGGVLRVGWSMLRGPETGWRSDEITLSEWIFKKMKNRLPLYILKHYPAHNEHICTVVPTPIIMILCFLCNNNEYYLPSFNK